MPCTSAGLTVPNRRAALALMAAVLAPLFLGACAGPGYYWQATTGHLQLLRARQDVDAVLADPGTDPLLRERLQLAAEILTFADQHVGLPPGGSYRTLVETGGGPVAWNVVVTPEFSLMPKRWCFPVAGCVSYRAYFDQARAQREADRQAARGLDVAVLPVQAYSTLGWFEDPLLDGMLAQSPARLAGSLLHELAHQRFYHKGDTAFSESYAGFVERTGVRQWLQQSGRHMELAEWQNQLDAQRHFAALLSETRRSLAALYESGQDETAMRAAKSDIFTGLRDRFGTLRVEQFQGRDYFSGWLAGELNNAHLALATAYQGGHCAFAELLRSVEGDFSEFHRRVEQVARLDATGRSDWLSQPCPPVASAHEL